MVLGPQPTTTWVEHIAGSTMPSTAALANTQQPAQKLRLQSSHATPFSGRRGTNGRIDKLFPPPMSFVADQRSIGSQVAAPFAPRTCTGNRLVPRIFCLRDQADTHHTSSGLAMRAPFSSRSWAATATLTTLSSFWCPQLTWSLPAAAHCFPCTHAWAVTTRAATNYHDAGGVHSPYIRSSRALYPAQRSCLPK